MSIVKRALETIKCEVKDIESAGVERSHPYDSKSNGATEIGVKIIRGMHRTLRLCLERRIGREVPPGHPLTAWLLEHTAILLNIRARGEDGKTPWERARGRPFGLKLYGFGEQVFWRLPSKGPQHDEQGNMSARMLRGVFLGYHRTSNSYLVMNEDGEVKKTRGLQRMCLDERWKVEKLAAVRAVPWAWGRRAERRPIELGKDVDKHQEQPHEQPSNPRRVRITVKTLEELKWFLTMH